MSEKTVVVVDDHAGFRQSAAVMIEARGYRVREYGVSRQALQYLESTTVDLPWCLLLDVRMPGMDGLGLHDELRARRVRIPVVYMTGHADVALAVEAMKKGAVTFLEKPLDFTALDKALNAAFNACQQPLPNAPAQSVEAFRERLALLTPRETEVMHSIVEGNANKVVAANLGISIKTVEVYRARLMKKLQVCSGPRLVRMVMSCQ